MPHREVGILHGELGQVGSLASGEGRVALAQFPEEDVLRPSVADDVVHRDQQVVVALAEADQVTPQQWWRSEVERAGHELGLQLRQRALGVRVLPQVRDRHRNLDPPVDELHRLPVVDGEPGAQRLVPVDHRGHGSPQCRDIQRAAQPQRHRDDVERVVLVELLHQPQPSLREGGGKPVDVVAHEVIAFVRSADPESWR